MIAAHRYQDAEAALRVYGEQWHSPLWQFVRLLKAHPSLSRMSAGEALDAVEGIMERWRRSVAGDVWSCWFPDVGNAEDARTEFLVIWVEIRYLPGHTPLDNAVERA